MELADLGPEARQALDALTDAIAKALERSKKLPHLTAMSHGQVPAGATADGVFNGGSLVAPAKPPFISDDHALLQLHRALFRAAGPDVLRTVVVRGTRENAHAKWVVTPRLVSVAEHSALGKARAELDAGIEAKLRALATYDDDEYIWFGRSNRAKSPQLVRKFADVPVEALEVTPEWEALLAQAEAIYREAGLTLVVMKWTIQEHHFETREHYE